VPLCVLVLLEFVSESGAEELAECNGEERVADGGGKRASPVSEGVWTSGASFTVSDGRGVGLSKTELDAAVVWENVSATAK